MSPRFAYSLLWRLALPFVSLRLPWRGRRQPGYLEQPGGRFARWPDAPERPLIWVHAVSVGETRAAEPLIRALRERYPAFDVLLTQMTATGRETARSLYGQNPNIHLAWLPYDLPEYARAFFQHFHPRVGIIMETELWPNLLHAARYAGVPVVLVNARLSERSQRRYARWPSLSRMTLGALDAVGAQTEGDAQRIRSIGAHTVTVTGNLKFDITPPEAQQALAQQFRLWTHHRPVLLLASTRDGEEALLLDACAAAGLPDDVLCVIVPRHPQRFDEVATLIETRGLKLARRSREDEIEPDTNVWLGDSMGEMFAYYGAADVTLIGGSWLPFGGQNLIEACAVGTPVIVGPHTFNFLQVAQQAVECGAALRADDATAGIRAAITLLSNDAARTHAADAGLAFAAAHRGATARTMTLLETRIT